VIYKIIPNPIDLQAVISQDKRLRDEVIENRLSALLDGEPREADHPLIVERPAPVRMGRIADQESAVPDEHAFAEAEAEAEAELADETLMTNLPVGPAALPAAREGARNSMEEESPRHMLSPVPSGAFNARPAESGAGWVSGLLGSVMRRAS